MKELFHELGLNDKEIEIILQSNKYHRIRKSRFSSSNIPTNREREIMTILYEKYKIPFYKIAMALGCSDNRIPTYCKTIKNRGHCVGQESQTTIFETIDSKEKAYLIGLIIADGCVQKETYSISVCVQEEDSIILKNLSLLFGGKQLITHKKQVAENKRTQTLHKLYWNSKKGYNDIINLGINPRKSKEGLNKIPPLKEEFIPDFIRGYWDGDGLSFANQKIGFCGDLKVLSYIKNFLLKKGISDNKITFNKSNNIYYLQWSKKSDVILLLKVMFDNCDNNLFIPRKINKYRPLFKELNNCTQNMLENPKEFTTINCDNVNYDTMGNQQG